MATFSQCPNCNCNSDGTEIYKCNICGKIFCEVCVEGFCCPHCGHDLYIDELNSHERKRLGRIQRRGKDDDDD